MSYFACMCLGLALQLALDQCAAHRWHGVAVTTQFIALALLPNIVSIITVAFSGWRMCWVGQVKQDAVAGYAGVVELCEPGMDAREAGAAAVQARTGAAFVSPYNDAAVMAGQGTVALELLEQARPDGQASSLIRVF